MSTFTDYKLLFSEDTIYFDTVFSSIGSATKELRIINSGKKSLKVDHIYLAGGSTSKYRLNIDGESVNEKHNIEIESGDSIFIFVDVFIDPGNSNSPIAVNDSIIFSTDEKIRMVNLEAWGQDIILIDNEILHSETWVKGKPYVVYKNVTIDTLERLTIEEGTKIYFHRNASMVIAGSILVNGSTESPVLFAGDRLEKMYEDIPGQWKGILFLNSATASIIDHAEIRNGIFGIQVGEAKSGSGFPALKLLSSEISHSAISGLSAIKGNIEAANSVFAHCGYSCIYLSSGGDYIFTNCTIFNLWEYGLRFSPALYISEKAENSGVIVSSMDVTFNNSVIFGGNQSEIGIISDYATLSGNYYFDHCLIKLDTLTSPFWDRGKFPSSIINRNPLFMDSGEWDLRPDTLSPLINRGSSSFLVNYPFDIRGVSRMLYGDPDIGAFERIPGEHRKNR